MDGSRLNPAGNASAIVYAVIAPPKFDGMSGAIAEPIVAVNGSLRTPAADSSTRLRSLGMTGCFLFVYLCIARCNKLTNIVSSRPESAQRMQWRDLRFIPNTNRRFRDSLARARKDKTQRLQIVSSTELCMRRLGRRRWRWLLPDTYIIHQHLRWENSVGVGRAGITSTHR